MISHRYHSVIFKILKRHCIEIVLPFQTKKCKNKCDEELLRASWSSRSDAAVAIKWNSTRQNHHVVQDTKKSGGQRVSFKCPKADGDGYARFMCAYRCCVKESVKNGTKTWKVVRTGEVGFRPHSERCLTQAKISTAEARKHTPKLGSVNCPLTVDATQERIATKSNVPKQSVSTYVGTRLRSEHASRYNTQCEANWGKLESYGREFVANNPGSHFHIEHTNGR